MTTSSSAQPRTHSPADQLAGAIEHAGMLDAVGERIADVTRRVLPQGRARDLLSGTPIGHPAHPALVLVPMGSLLSATMLDLLGGAKSRPAARRLVALGLLSAGPAAVAGANDWVDTGGAEKRVGLVHWGLNVVALSLYAKSWGARRRGRHLRASALGVLGAGVLGGSGWLGGHLAYSLGVGVDTTAFSHMAADWTDVGSVDDLDRPGATLVGDAGGTPVLVVRTVHGLGTIGNRCTHRGGPLNEGAVEGSCVRCPWHGSVFDVRSGAVVSGPASRPQPHFEVRTHEGRIQVRRADEQSSLRQDSA